MAVATPVLERKIESTRQSESVFDWEADARHNACIRENFKRLFDMDLKGEEIVNRIDESAMQPVQSAVAMPVMEEAPRQEVIQQTAMPRFVQSAWTNSPIFRADSAINAVPVVQPVIQPVATSAVTYKTLSSTKSTEEAKATFTRKEKIIMAAFVGIVIALFALIIVNSAIIAGLNADVSTLQGVLDTSRGAFAGVSTTLMDLQNSFLERVANWVEDTNFILG